MCNTQLSDIMSHPISKKFQSRLFRMIQGCCSVSLLMLGLLEIPSTQVDLQSVQAATPSSSGPVWSTRVAKSSDSFVNSIGVNTHLHYTNTVYNRFHDIIKPRLLELGIKHIRDGAYTYTGINSNSFYYQRIRDLASSGIRFNLITSVRTRSLPQTDYRLLSQIYTWSNGSISAFEGVNEPDLNLRGNPDWFNITRTSQQTLYNTVKGDPKLRHVPVIAPSITTVKEALPSLAAWSDYGNLHNYFGGRHPETTGWGGNGYGSIEWNKTYVAAPIVGSKPIISTETGWYNATQGSNTPYGIPEDIAGKYMPRMFLAQFNSGIIRTYLYEFIDQGTDQTYREATFGLLRNNGTPKPAYTALKNLMGLLKDPGSAFQPGTMTYLVEGNVTNLQQTLLQKRNGDFYLALWLGESAWNPVTKTRVSVASRPLTVTLSGASRSVTGYRFNANGSTSTVWIQPTHNRFSVNLDDRLLLLKVSAK
jgi:hypothetical protein